MQPAKQEALDVIAKVPDDADMDEIIYRLYILEKIRKGRTDAETGRITSLEELEREMASW